MVLEGGFLPEEDLASPSALSSRLTGSTGMDSRMGWAAEGAMNPFR